MLRFRIKSAHRSPTFEMEGTPSAMSVALAPPPASAQEPPDAGCRASVRPAIAAVGVVACLAGLAVAAPTFQRDFDGPEIAWALLDTSQPAQVLDQRCVTDVVRDGAGSARVTLLAPAGESAQLVSPTGRLPVINELQVRLWVRASRPGVRLAVRVVMPRSIDPATGASLATIVRGPASDQVGRWQQLSLSGIPRLLADQVRVLRARPGAKVDPREAFVDAVVLLVPGGPGQTVVWTDQLEADGVLLASDGDSTGPNLQAADGSTTDDRVDRPSGWRREFSSIGGPAGTETSPIVQLQGRSLLVEDKPFVPRAIRWNGEPMAFLAERGFNTLVLTRVPSPNESAQARKHNLWLICPPPLPDELAQSGLGAATDRVLAWDFGDPLASGTPDLDYVRRWVAAVRRQDPLPNRPILMEPLGDWSALGTLADVLVAGHPRSGTIPATDFAEWLQGRPRLVRPGTPFWVRIPTQPGRLVQQQAHELVSAIRAPLSVDPSQVEALVRIASARDCHGFLFESLTPLNADDEPTRQRANLLELVNRKLLMIEPWLARGKVVGRVASSDAAEAAIVLQVEQARLLVPLDELGPGESRPDKPDTLVTEQRSLVVPGVPESNQVFLLSPAGLRPLKSNRVAGGILVVFDRDDDGMLLMTEDLRVISSFRQGALRLGRPTAQLARELAVAEGKQVVATDRQLAPLGLADAVARQNVTAAGTLTESCDRQLTAGDADRAYQSAGAARRQLALAASRQRQLLAVPNLLASSPLLVGYDTLVHQAALARFISNRQAGANQLHGGDFEDLGQLMQSGWQHVDHPVPGVTAGAELSTDRPRHGTYCLRLSAAASAPGQGPALVPGAPVRVVSPPVPVSAGQTIEITGWVRVSEPIAGTIDGLQIVDSLGGLELALAVRQTGDWQPFRLVRAVPEPTAVTLTFALTGLGSASVDAVMVRTIDRPAIRRLPPVTSPADTAEQYTRGIVPRPDVASGPRPLPTSAQ